MIGRRLFRALALAALPCAALAQTPPAPAAAPAGVTVDWGGWFQWFGYYTDGAVGTGNDLPRWAVAPPNATADTTAAGMSVRQSRLRATIGLPADGLLGGATLKGFVELDFLGGNVANDISLPIARFRHGWVTASWKDLGNMSLLVGQTWGIFTGPYFANSLAHLAIPRLGGAGFLFRRAPQVRLSGDLGTADFGLLYTVGLLHSADLDTSNGTQVGERAAVPDVEARVAAVYRPGGKKMAEVGLSAHRGANKYQLSTGDETTVASQGFAVDGKIDVAMVTLVGAAWTGENLDVWYTATKGVNKTGTPATPDDVTAVKQQGAWAQAQVNPMKGLQLLLGAGVEVADTADLVANDRWRSRQVSGGVVVNLTSKWRCSLEFTRYVTDYVTAGTFTANQWEIGSLYAF